MCTHALKRTYACHEHVWTTHTALTLIAHEQISFYKCYELNLYIIGPERLIFFGSLYQSGGTLLEKKVNSKFVEC